MLLLVLGARCLVHWGRAFSTWHPAPSMSTQHRASSTQHGSPASSVERRPGRVGLC